MTWNVSDINRRPPPLSEPTRPYPDGVEDPLAIRIRALIRRVAEDAHVHPQVAQDWLQDRRLPAAALEPAE